MGFYINPCAASLFVSIFYSFEAELLTQFPASNQNNIISKK